MDIIVKINEIQYEFNDFHELINFDQYDKITFIDCSHNESFLTELPKLPHELQRLLCYNNNITKLPKLPNKLIELDCSSNKLTSLPELPDSLRELLCSDNELKCLPKLPAKLN